LIDANELIRNADAAMSIAKHDGKGHYQVFEPAMHSDVLARLDLQADLQRALVNDEFELYYQPIIRLNDGTVSAVEALIRWQHPTRGLLSPDAFIPFAEESGLIIAIGRWVLREACRYAKTMQDEIVVDPPLSINVNLSVRQLQDKEVVTEVELKQLGVKIAVDDFGTGYSSLGYLARFPVDVIKMVAEGIEVAEEWDTLRELGCGFGQATDTTSARRWTPTGRSTTSAPASRRPIGRRPRCTRLKPDRLPRARGR
jgi:sensor c-di-GMP phosphodiesterase-like protein